VSGVVHGDLAAERERQAAAEAERARRADSKLVRRFVWLCVGLLFVLVLALAAGGAVVWCSVDFDGFVRFVHSVGAWFAPGLPWFLGGLVFFVVAGFLGYFVLGVAGLLD
jgi:hypothetical protein